jgi:hypothetical protein
LSFGAAVHLYYFNRALDQTPERVNAFFDESRYYSQFTGLMSMSAILFNFIALDLFPFGRSEVEIQIKITSLVIFAVTAIVGAMEGCRRIRNISRSFYHYL